MRVGMGYDVHKLVEGRDLILGGVKIPHTLGLLGHSDADVLLHAIMDALLGAAALGDIGKHFPGYRSTVQRDLEYQIIRACCKTDRGKRIYCGEYRRNDHCTETENASIHRGDGEEYCDSIAY